MRVWFQRVLTIALMAIIPIFVISHFKVLKAKKRITPSVSQDFLIETSAPSNKNFVFVMPLHSDTAMFQQQLQSVMTQNYPEFSIICIDNGDATAARAEAIKMASIHNLQQSLSFYNVGASEDLISAYFEIVHRQNDQDVIVHLDQSDWLAHNSVLEILNHFYSNEDVWLTYSQYMEYPSYRKGNIKPFAKRYMFASNMQKTPWVVSPFKTFYAGLMKQVDPNLKKYSPFQTFDESLKEQLIPLVDISRQHIRFIDDVLLFHTQVKHP